MAKTGKYIEVTDGFDFVETVDGITATRQFLEDSTLSANTATELPEMGNKYDEPGGTSDPLKYTGVKVVQLSKKCLDKHPLKFLWTVSYSSSPSASTDAEEAISSGDLPISGSLGGQILSIKNEDSNYYKWNSDNVVVSQLIPKRVPSGAFKVSKRLRILPLGKFAEYAGCINSTTLSVANRGSLYGVGTVMFTGVSYEEYKNNEGYQRWKVDFSFEWMSVPLATEGQYGGWNYLFREDEGDFELVTPALYTSKDLNKLFGDPSNL